MIGGSAFRGDRSLCTLRPAVGLVCLFLLGCSGSGDFDEPLDFEAPATAVLYTPEVIGAPNEEIEDLLSDSLAIFRRQKEGAQSLAFLSRRADGDVETVQKILRAYGYYRPSVETEVIELFGEDAKEVERPCIDDLLSVICLERTTDAPDAELTRARAVVRIDPGRQFILSRHDFLLAEGEDRATIPLGTPGDYGSPVGRGAAAQEILDAEAAAVVALRSSGYIYAAQAGRDALADLEAATIEVDTAINAGGQYVFGPITFVGVESVETAYLLTYLAWEEGDVADPARLNQYQRALLGTGLFRSGFVTFPETPPDGTIAPVTVELVESLPRTVSAGLRYSTDDGPGARASFEHRNVRGSNETARITLDVSLDEQILDGEYRIPQFYRSGQDLVAAAEARRVTEDAYEEIGITIGLGLSRTLGPRWTVGAGGLLEVSDIDGSDNNGRAYLAGLPVSAAYDSTVDLLNPVDGERLHLLATPFMGLFAEEPTLFTVLEADGRIYRPLDSAGRFVAAARGRIGFAPSGSLADIPAPHRLYSGGSGSVRGFAEDVIGPLDDSNDPTGGRSVIELGGEFRFPIWGDLGGVAFVESGAVSEDLVPTFEDGVQYAAGGGVRYYSPVGPIRVDVAVPLNPRDSDDSYQFYISIGQAF